MSGVKRKIEDKDPDYEDITQVQGNKRSKVVEQNAREAAVQKIEAIIKDQFSLEMKNKEHEIEVIGQRLNEARRMMDKLRACIVANYYANAGQPKVPEASKSDPSVLNHPAIKRFYDPSSRSSSPLNQNSETPSQAQSETESLSQHGEAGERETDSGREDGAPREQRPGRNTGKDTFGIPSSLEQHVTYHTTGEEASRLYMKKTIVVGNVSKYIAPDKREENDQSTHKWMVYVRGSRKEPSIDHFVKKVWFFLHPSYKPNDLVEVSEPPFHLTRRGWGEFPVRVQIHFKDQRNKRIDIIHHLKLDRTYTGLQTLGAETVVDVELHRNSLGDDFIPSAPSSSSSPSSSSHLLFVGGSGSSSSTAAQGSRRPSSPSQHTHDDQPSSDRVPGVTVKSESVRSSCSERNSQSNRTEKITLGSHGKSAFQPITASCKIIPQGQVPSPAESPGKSFQPITMSCKIVSGSPISTPSHSPLPRTSSSTPGHMKSSPSVINNPYIIVDKPGHVINMAASTPASTGSPSAKQSSTAHGARSPAPKVHTSSFLSSGVKVIIKQEPGEVPTQPSPQQQVVSTATSQQQQQYVTVKGGHMIAMSPQKQSGTGTGGGATPSKVLGIPLGSAVKQVSMSSGQILVAKSSPTVSKVVGQKQVVAQGVAKAIVSGGASGASGITGQQVHAVTKAASGSGGSGKSGVMATLQLPANNLANLANLPPGTKLYLTTNSKNPSGKGKLLLIPQGAILRASHSAGQQSQSSGSGGSHSSSGSSGSGSLPSNLSYTSYILKQTPQGTFLVGQPGGSGKQTSGGHVASSPASSTQQAIRVTAGQKAAILAQVCNKVVGGSQASQVKLSDGSVKMVTSAAASHLSKPGTTTLRMTGGVITATSLTPSTPSSTPTSQQSAEATGGSSSQLFPHTAKVPPQHPVLVAANQAAVISAAKSASSAASTAKSSASGTGTIVTFAKTVNMPLISLSKGAGSSVVGGSKTSSPSLVTAASLIGGGTVSGKTAATISGMLKLHPAQSSSQQTVVTIPSNQLKQLSVGSGSSGLQSILMPVSKVMQSGAKGASGSNIASSASTPVAQVKTEPGLVSSTCTTPVPQPSAPASTAPTSGPLPTTHTSTDAAATIKVEQGVESSTHELNTEHIENMTQLLTAIVKKFPLIVPEKNEDSHPFCATSVDQYYSWNIGKRRAAELQRAVAVRRVCADLLERTPRLQALTPPRTKEVLRWCRLRGYTPPDPEAQRTEEDSIEDILTQIDSEPECSSTLTGCEELSQRLKQLQRILKAEPEEEDDEPLDIISVKDIDAAKVKIKLEQEEAEQEPKFFLGRCQSTQFIRDTSEQIGVRLQQVEVEKNVFAPVVETIILKAVEQFASEILRESLANAHGKSQQNRTPREISAMDVHQAISSIPTCDFLTNRYMGIMVKDEGHAD
ncbi:YEATS domain-containing protein 2 isoform X1 [Carassius gibelio]|uniref:YEATS domain-containing protein 2 isoform X1 n=1 Tax=Carassius gibelio TaxID=101364 RepID=UPI002278AB23|nr:YEATS domain-containing protein 2 isoform X1 [Carassius gibelio]XP_052388216.1 YEATS domain-containing protein 2 isoform X1 [Carassius gibelio]XP_052388227.1 YEATS domain-containing protein 2 isoform X1 [Carassius gibelio]